MKVEKLIWRGEELNEAVGGAKRVAKAAMDIVDRKYRRDDRGRW